jgi:hypothetical protein
LQYIDIAGILGFSEEGIMRTIIGTSFDWKDIACYAAGCLLILLFEKIFKREKSTSSE